MKIKSLVIAVMVIVNGLGIQIAQAKGAAEKLKVAAVRVDANGKGMVGFVSPITGTPPPCGTYRYHLAFDLNTEAGRAIHSMVLTAKASDASIYARGDGTCTIYSVVENWGWGQIE